MSLFQDILSETYSNSDDLMLKLPPIIPLEEINDPFSIFPFSSCELKRSDKREKAELFKVSNKTRKEKEDNIRKKIKTNFFKILREVVNTKLKEAGAEYVFECFPQGFIVDITRKTNYEALELTYEELFDYAYNKMISEKSNQEKEYIKSRKETSEKKYKKNKETMEYLKVNSKISEKSGWERIRNMKYIDLLKAYFNSYEFQQVVEQLSKKESKFYIDAYKHFASTLVEYFQSYEPNEKNPKKKGLDNISVSNRPFPLFFPHISLNEEKKDCDDILDSFFSSRNGNFEKTNAYSLFDDDNNFLFKRDGFSIM